jgi:hypothetical protein
MRLSGVLAREYDVIGTLGAPAAAARVTRQLCDDTPRKPVRK